MEDNYKRLFNDALLLRADGAIRHRDITVLVALTSWLDFENFKDVKNKRLAHQTDLDKSDISKSIKALKACNLLLENNSGFIFNPNRNKYNSVVPNLSIGEME